MRVYEPVEKGWWRPAVVIVGPLDDIKGTSIETAIEIVAAVIRRAVFPSGRRFVLVEHYPDRLEDRNAPAFAVVRFTRCECRPEWPIWAHLAQLHVEIDRKAGVRLVAPVAEMRCGFEGPSWHPVDHHELQQALGCDVAVWPAGAYTAAQLAGEAGRKLVELVNARGEDLSGPGEVR